MFKLAIGLLCLPMAALAQSEISFPAADGVTVFADFYGHAGDRRRGIILLFHQADANAAEYGTIAPHLAALGFDSIAVDQRSGGNMFTGTNRTAAALGQRAPYEAAIPDLEAALAYATDSASADPIILWGSSYSSSLAIVVAARHPEVVDGVLAFSPGQYFSALIVADEAATLAVPAYLTASGTDEEMAAVAAIASAIPAGLATVVDPVAGRHGSSTLIENANPGGWADNWRPVEAFLDRVAP